MDKVYFTKEGLKALKKELAELMEEKRPQLVKRLTQARNMGDLSENAEYTSAREELSLADGRIEELEVIITKARVIRAKVNKGSQSEVKLGCKVTLKINRATHAYTVVGEWEADPENKKISHSSPLGKALIGKKVGEKIEIEAPAGKVSYLIKNIE